VPDETGLEFGVLVIVIYLGFGAWDLVLSVVKNGADSDV